MSWAGLFSNDVTESLSWFGTLETDQSNSGKLDDYQAWLDKYHSENLTYSMGERHLRLWAWIESLSPGIKNDPRVEVWPRGGAKSSTAELAVAYLGEKLTRNFVLYVSETQDQANKHVAAIATALEKSGIKRALSTYGHSKGWKINQLRCENGFNVVALGLDASARGIKLDHFRPGLIVFDDIDNEKDNAKATAKKLKTIKTSIIPTGAADCSILFIQNLIIEDGIVSQLVDGRADFLMNRDVPPIEPAAYDLTVELVPDPDREGRQKYIVTGGTPTWEGQGIATIQAQINEIGLDSFLREAQHQVAGASGVYFKAELFRSIPLADLPKMVALCRAYDFASTDGGGDYTVGVLMGVDANGVYYVLDVVRGQWSTETVWDQVLAMAESDRLEWGVTTVRLPLDPGTGRMFAVKLSNELKKRGFVVRFAPVGGKKHLRSKSYQKEVNSGNVMLVEAPWNFIFKEEHRKFREDESHEHDDQTDAATDAHGGLTRTALGGAA
jgi:predicted phage terminase large subunit-like protein